MAENPLKNRNECATNKSVDNTSTSVSEAENNKFFDNLVWLNSAEAADYLRKSADAVRIAVSRGQLRARKWRRRLYFKKSELDFLLESASIKGGL